MTNSDRLRRLRPTWGVVFVTLVAIVYACTLYKGIGGRVNHGDSAKFQFIGTIAGISHPPGNPLYLTISMFFQRLPLGLAPGTKASLLSAIFGVIAVACVYDAIRKVRSPLAATVGASSLAFGPLFWTLSTEAEVYSLNAALLAASVSGLARWTVTQSQRALAVGVACFVLAFGNHLTMVAAIPALVVAAVIVQRKGALKWPLFAVGAAMTVITLAFYLYIPWRHGKAPYSEFDAPLTRASFWEYVSAKKFQEGFGVPTLADAVRVRLPMQLTFLQKQWLWPVLGLAAIGALRLMSFARALGAYVLLATLGFLGFAFVYDIPDPDGFYVPVIVLLSVLIGCGVPTRARLSGVALIVAFALLAAPAWLFLKEHQRQVGLDVVEEMGDGQGNILLDLPDLVRRIPEGSKLALPCNHYGCIEVVNYYRFADETAKERRIEVVQLTQGLRYGLPGPAPKLLAPAAALTDTFCSIRASDAAAMRGAGAEVPLLERPGRMVNDLWFPGVPIWCSVPKR